MNYGSEKKVVAKRYVVGDNVIVAICDVDLLNKTIVGEKGLKITLKESFYGNEPLSEDEVEELLKGVTSINAVGTESVNIVLKKGFGSSRSIVRIGGVPHLIFMKI